MGASSKPPLRPGCSGAPPPPDHTLGGHGRLPGARTGQAWTPERLERAPRCDPDDRLLAIAAGMRQADPELTLAGLATRIEAMSERPPRQRQVVTLNRADAPG